MSPTDHNHTQPLAITNPRKEEPKRKLTRRERRDFQRKLKNPKFKKRILRIISEKKKKEEGE